MPNNIIQETKTLISVMKADFPKNIKDRRIPPIKELIEDFKSGTIDELEIIEYTKEYREEYLNLN